MTNDTINGLEIGQKITLKSEPFPGVGFEATIAGPATNAWRVTLSDGRSYNVDEADLAGQPPATDRELGDAIYNANGRRGDC